MNKKIMRKKNICIFDAGIKYSLRLIGTQLFFNLRVMKSCV